MGCGASSDSRFKAEYTVKNELGAGRFSVVYHCKRHEDDSACAVKCVKLVGSNPKMLREMTEREVSRLTEPARQKIMP